MSSQATTTTPSQPLTGASSCCDSGRPIITDPLTGQTVCSCQYDSQAQQLLNYQRLASTLPLNVYGSPYGDQGYLPLTAEQSAFYTPSDNLGGWPYPASMYYPYDPTLSGYPFANGYGVDLNGARRKNATRETTSTLKAWLSEHRKNPYPTKGEKIMLAIITKMTLTQVSTWFANARRRLKKENKVTWEPRNRVDDDDNDDASDTNDRDPVKLDKDPKINDNGFDPRCQKPLPPSDNCNSSNRQLHKDNEDEDDDDLCLPNGGTMDTSHRDSMSSPGSSILSDSHSSLQSPVLTDSPSTSLTSTGLQDSQSLKPRIWSIVDTATSHNNQHHHTLPTNNNNFMGVGFGVGSSGLFAPNGAAGGFGSAAAVGGGGGPAVKVSQQFARNLRLGYTSPYTKAAWFNGAFGSAIAPTIPVTCTTTPAVSAPLSTSSLSSSSPSSSSSSSSTSVSLMSSSSPVVPPSSSVYSTMCNSAASLITTSCLTTSVASSLASNGQTVDACNLLLNPLVKSNMVTAVSTAAPTSYPMSIAAAAAAAHNNPTVSVNSALFNRTYAQTIHNLTSLTKGLIMAPQLSGSFIGSMKTSAVQQDQRSELQSSTS